MDIVAPDCLNEILAYVPQSWPICAQVCKRLFLALSGARPTLFGTTSGATSTLSPTATSGAESTLVVPNNGAKYRQAQTPDLFYRRVADFWTVMLPADAHLGANGDDKLTQAAARRLLTIFKFSGYYTADELAARGHGRLATALIKASNGSNGPGTGPIWPLRNMHILTRPYVNYASADLPLAINYPIAKKCPLIAGYVAEYGIDNVHATTYDMLCHAIITMNKEFITELISTEVKTGYDFAALSRATKHCTLDFLKWLTARIGPIREFGSIKADTDNKEIINWLIDTWPKRTIVVASSLELIEQYSDRIMRVGRHQYSHAACMALTKAPSLPIIDVVKAVARAGHVDILEQLWHKGVREDMLYYAVKYQHDSLLATIRKDMPTTVLTMRSFHILQDWPVPGQPGRKSLKYIDCFNTNNLRGLQAHKCSIGALKYLGKRGAFMSPKWALESIIGAKRSRDNFIRAQLVLKYSHATGGPTLYSHAGDQFPTYGISSELLGLLSKYPELLLWYMRQHWGGVRRFLTLKQNYDAIKTVDWLSPLAAVLNRTRAGKWRLDEFPVQTTLHCKLSELARTVAIPETTEARSGTEWARSGTEWARAMHLLASESQDLAYFVHAAMTDQVDKK